jgi:hypothetical protein
MGIYKTEKQQIFHAKMLSDVKNILDKYNIICILTNSALLGVYRDGDMIHHCPGAVLTTFYDQIKPLEFKIIEDLKKLNFKILKHFINKSWKLKVGKEGLNIEIVGYQESKKFYYRQMKRKKKVIPKKLLKPPFSKIKLRGVVYNAPPNIEKFLNYLYNDWTIKLTSDTSPSSYKTTKHMVVNK